MIPRLDPPFPSGGDSTGAAPFEQQLDALLHALTAAEPAADFAQRLTTRLRTVAAASPPAPAPPAVQSPSASLAPSTAQASVALSFPQGVCVSPEAPPPPRAKPRLYPWPVAALAAAAAGCLFAILLRPHPPAAATHEPFTPPSPSVAQSQPSPLPQTPPEAPIPVIHLALTNDPAAHRPNTLREVPTAITNVEAQLDQQALEDLHSPSHPAPPLPPTQQERLVALMLRRGERHDLAQLETGKQDALLRGERAAFTQFFDPPVDPALLNQPRSLASQAAPSGSPTPSKE